MTQAQSTEFGSLDPCYRGTQINEQVPKQKTRLLVIDDEPLMTDLFSQFMTKLGFDVVIATGGQEGLDYLANASDIPDIVITDLTMPEMNGVEFARILAAVRPELPVIIDTGFAASGELTNLPSNITAIVQKPFQYTVLAAKIDKILASNK